MNAKFRDGLNATGCFGAPDFAKSVRRALKGGVLALLLVFVWFDLSLACTTPGCESFVCITADKYVSTNGLAGPWVRNSVTTVNPNSTSDHPLLASVPGTNNVPSSSVLIPTDFYGDPAKVLYKFVITNCGNVKLTNVRLGDCIDKRSIGASGFLLGGADQCEWNPLLIPSSRVVTQALDPGVSVAWTSVSFPCDPISFIDTCGTFGRARTNGIIRNNSLVYADAYLNGVKKTVISEDLNLVQCKDYIPAPAALGDRVWKDLNGNGIQDCQDTNNNGIIGDAGDIGPECGAGIPGVPVNLVNCTTPSTVLKSTVTGANGFYLFDKLAAGNYCVKFNPAPTSTCAVGVPQFTTQNAGSNDALDSDANPITGVSPSVTLISGQTNRTVDAGVICKACPLTVDKKCVVETAPPAGFVCSAAKPIDSVTMIWTGQAGIYIKAWKGTPGGTLLAVVGPIATGQKVTIIGMGGSPLDQVWEVFSGSPDPLGGNKLGQSQFHISCSDVDMNGPEDCGKLEGNAKTTGTSLINLWRFDGMAGNGQTLACTPASRTGADACDFAAGPTPSCTSLGVKPKTLTFKYTGNDCSASQNSQASDKWFCSGVPGTNPIIVIVKDPAKITVSPTSGFKVGDLITVSAIGSDMGTEIQFLVGGQSVKIHTSCSQPLVVGNVFGSLELVQFNGKGAGAKVTYSYDVKNTGNAAVDITSVSDDKLGELLQQTSTLQAGGALTLQKSAFISQTTTNKVTATARLAGTATVCNQPSDQVTVTVTPPAIAPCTFGKPIALVFQYTGQACSASDNDQAADKWSCSGSPNGAQPVQVVMMKDASLIAVMIKNDVNGNGMIDVGDTFEMRRTDGREFAADTLFNIVSGSTILQSLKIHTSCSQPLNLGDQFGSVILKGFVPKP